MISNKAEMYRMLHRGDFGNTVPMWFDPREWWEMIHSKIKSGYRIDGSPLHWWGGSLTDPRRTMFPKRWMVGR